jgi:F-type H+-transporting ATPase subunit delta
MSTGSEIRLQVMDSVLDEARARSVADKGIVGRVLGAVQGAPTASDLEDLAGDLFAMVDALDSSVALRRAVTDPSTPEAGRRQLVHNLLDGKMSKTAINIVADGAAMRWSGGSHFAAALERQAVRAQLMQADEAGHLGEAEDELFRFARVVEGNPELRNTLSDRGVDTARRQELVTQLLADRASATTIALARRAVVARDRSFTATIETFVTLAADQRNRVIATVRVAQPLTEEQRTRLQATLSRQAGRRVDLQEIIDPGVIGGIRVELGDEIIEGTVAARLEAARRMFG